MITTKQIEELALHQALMVVFVNVGEEGWPDDPMEFLERARDEDGFESNDEMVPWQPFEYYDAHSLCDEVHTFATTFEQVINEALILDRG